ncbi:membrane protein [Saccharothrix violaceirubra]|uniref:Membrane protein YdbS with pleckstrin-like domain n=1 Tax=Saccharothrix violaceirubra TaxID=413306 RepID=A0A7W7SYC7_9PSEU|nr:hypothetical protein [Saccharothrix violaceirubra]MBB4963216.1 membrane protein YdbS with pleckstrin-like domain [Saccharothrix violaceirubra]
MSESKQVPVAVRVAGVFTAVEGLLGLGFAVALVVRAFAVDEPGKVLGEAAYFVVLCAGVLACGIGLVLGRRWARSPAIVVQLLLLGVAWYMYGPSARQLWGALLALYVVLVIGSLFTNPVRRWALGVDEEDE